MLIFAIQVDFCKGTPFPRLNKYSGLLHDLEGGINKLEHSTTLESCRFVEVISLPSIYLAIIIIVCSSPFFLECPDHLSQVTDGCHYGVEALHGTVLQLEQPLHLLGHELAGRNYSVIYISLNAVGFPNDAI